MMSKLTNSLHSFADNEINFYGLATLNLSAIVQSRLDFVVEAGIVVGEKSYQLTPARNIFISQH